MPRQRSVRAWTASQIAGEAILATQRPQLQGGLAPASQRGQRRQTRPTQPPPPREQRRVVLSHPITAVFRALRTQPERAQRRRPAFDDLHRVAMVPRRLVAPLLLLFVATGAIGERRSGREKAWRWQPLDLPHTESLQYRPTDAAMPARPQYRGRGMWSAEDCGMPMRSFRSRPLQLTRQAAGDAVG